MSEERDMALYRHMRREMGLSDEEIRQRRPDLDYLTACECHEEQESLRKQRANWNAVADGMAPPYPSEY